MKYISSRGGGEAVSFEEAIGTGYAADGGLYMPETLPAISKEDLEAWKHLDYASLAFAVLWPFVEGEMEADDLRRVLAGCYDDFSVDDAMSDDAMSDDAMSDDGGMFPHPYDSNIMVPRYKLRWPLEFLVHGNKYGQIPKETELLPETLRATATSDANQLSIL